MATEDSRDAFRMSISGFQITALLGLRDVLKDSVLKSIDTTNILYLEQVAATALLIQLIQEEISFRDTLPFPSTETGPRIVANSLKINGVPVDSTDKEAVRDRIGETRTEQLGTDA